MFVIIVGIEQGWVFAMAKSIFAWTVEKTCSNWQKTVVHNIA